MLLQMFVVATALRRRAFMRLKTHAAPRPGFAKATPRHREAATANSFQAQPLRGMLDYKPTATPARQRSESAVRRDMFIAKSVF
jgi:hypothetical protein